MPALQQLREGLHEAWGSVVEGWQRLSKRAAGAMTRFTPRKQRDSDTSQELAVRNSGWGVLAAELYDDEDKVVVRLEVPGLEKDDFDIQVTDGCLVVRGDKRLEREWTEGYYRIAECAYGYFERAIPLPEEVDSDRARARYEQGVLRVELPKAAHVRRRKVPVELKQQ